MEKINFESLELEISDSVYVPHEDSFLLSKYSKKLKGKVLEIGCGSGIQSLINAKTNPENKVIGVDINEKAVSNSIHNAKLNKIKNAEFFSSDLFSKIPKEKFDAIIFNPPYLPTTEDEKLDSDENFAYDGGKDGRKTLEKFLDSFSNYLTQEGILVLLQSSLNDLEKTKTILDKKSFECKILDQESFFFEKIYVLECKKRK